VIVRLCHLNDPCDAHPLAQCARNRAYLGQLQAWCRVAPEVFVWDYFNNFAKYFMPYPNLDAICADIPLYARAGVTGLFAQMDAMPPKGPGDMAELRAYLIARLLWRPELDGRAVIDEFLNDYYGPAAEPLRDYLERLHAPARRGAAHLGPYLPMNAELPFLKPEFMAQAERLCTAAAHRVKRDEELARRVAAARLPVDYYRYWQTQKPYRFRRGRFAPADRDAAKRGRAFLIAAMAYGTEGLHEQSGRPIRDELRALEGAAVTVLRRGRCKLSFAPEMGGRILCLIDPATGRDWMHRARPSEPGFPTAGGYEEYSQARWRSPGWAEAYACWAHAATADLSAALGEGLVLERRYRLMINTDGAPELAIESVLKNAGYGHVNCLLRLHPEFQIFDWRRAVVRLWRADGRVVELQPWRATRAPAGEQWLQGTDAPAGRWALRQGRRELTLAFGAGVTKCHLSWDRKLRVVRMDMFGANCRLAPQERIFIRQTWTFSGGSAR
jgi:hypothetical protein